MSPKQELPLGVTHLLSISCAKEPQELSSRRIALCTLRKSSYMRFRFSSTQACYVCRVWAPLVKTTH